MSESNMVHKKGRNFREIIEAEKHRGIVIKKIMRALTSIDTSVLYGGSFLFTFLVLAAIFYYLLMPSVFVWAGILVVAALVSSLLAMKITNALRKSQWKYRTL
ncbi:MAG: hypothetical protein NWE96_02905 [Candidatus Bathyarchaeota archaeon]|nr:hypothetical protein [Candidatus Bathyarchaeota archaeon]